MCNIPDASTLLLIDLQFSDTKTVPTEWSKFCLFEEITYAAKRSDKYDTYWINTLD